MKTTLLFVVAVAAWIAMAVTVATRPQPPAPEPAKWCFVSQLGYAVLCRDLPGEKRV